MPDLVIKEAEIKQLDSLIAPIPTQYGLPLVNFLNRVSQIRAQEADAAQKESGLKDQGPSESKVTAPKKVKKEPNNVQ